MDNFDYKKYLREGKLREDYHSLRTPGRSNKEIISFYRSVKPGDKVKYVGPEKNSFKPGETYEVGSLRDEFEGKGRIVILKNNGKKIRVKGQSSIEPIK